MGQARYDSNGETATTEMVRELELQNPFSIGTLLRRSNQIVS